jgi:GNAT superfamily N-acetyltransferase
MTPDAALVAAADRNFVGSYRKLVDHCPTGEFREFGGVAAFTTRAPIATFNGCIVAGPAGDGDIAAALEWVASLDVSYRLWVRDELADQVRSVVLRRGMTESPWRDPHMVLDPIPDRPVMGPGLTTREVLDRRSLAEFRGVFMSDGLPADVATDLFPDSFAADPDVRLMVAYIDDRSAGTSIAIRTGDCCGVYAVSTLPGARRRGVGTAATWAAVAVGQAWGSRAIVLQSSEMGLPLYEALGFRTVARYRVFVPPT